MITAGEIQPDDLANADFGEFTCNGTTCTIDDSVAVSSWNLTTPTFTTNFTFDGVTLQAGYHALSHHGNDKDMIRDLIKVESEHMKCLDRFLSHLNEKKDAQGRRLLDSTIVLFGTGMGNASVHSNADLPTLVAGGGFKHGSHIKTDRKAKGAHLLGDLYITILNQMGIESDRFANASRKMTI